MIVSFDWYNYLNDSMLAILWLSIILVIEDWWLLFINPFDIRLRIVDDFCLIIVDYIDLRMESKLNNSNTVSFPVDLILGNICYFPWYFLRLLRFIILLNMKGYYWLNQGIRWS